MECIFVEPGDPSLPPLVLLHGSGGNERDMLPVAQAVAPTAAAFSVRGRVAWENGYAFFKRFPDRSLDEASIRAEVPILAAFVAEISARQPSWPKPILVGFSNGAIMAAAQVMMFPNLAQGAALLRPLPPFATPMTTRLPGLPVLVIDATDDVRRLSADGVEMAAQLHQAGARVDHQRVSSGHDLTNADLQLLRGWLVDGFALRW